MRGGRGARGRADPAWGSRRNTPPTIIVCDSVIRQSGQIANNTSPATVFFCDPAKGSDENTPSAIQVQCPCFITHRYKDKPKYVAAINKVGGNDQPMYGQNPLKYATYGISLEIRNSRPEI